MPIATILESVCQHRDVVPAYFVRSTGHWIVAGVANRNAGAVVIDPSGAIVSAHPSKRAALASIRA